MMNSVVSIHFKLRVSGSVTQIYQVHFFDFYRRLEPSKSLEPSSSCRFVIRVCIHFRFCSRVEVLSLARLPLSASLTRTATICLASCKRCSQAYKSTTNCFSWLECTARMLVTTAIGVRLNGTAMLRHLGTRVWLLGRHSLWSCRIRKVQILLKCILVFIYTGTSLWH